MGILQIEYEQNLDVLLRESRKKSTDTALRRMNTALLYMLMWLNLGPNKYPIVRMSEEEALNCVWENAENGRFFEIDYFNPSRVEGVWGIDGNIDTFVEEPMKNIDDIQHVINWVYREEEEDHGSSTT